LQKGAQGGPAQVKGGVLGARASKSLGKKSPLGVYKRVGAPTQCGGIKNPLTKIGGPLGSLYKKRPHRGNLFERHAHRWGPHYRDGEGLPPILQPKGGGSHNGGEKT